MSMFTSAPGKVRKVSVRSGGMDRPVASNKRNGSATSKCAAFQGCRKNTARKITGLMQQITNKKSFASSFFRKSRRLAIKTQQSKKNTGGVNAWKTIR